MRRIVLATLIAAAGLAVGTTQAATAATDAVLSLGNYCDGTQAVLVIDIINGSGETFDVKLDSDLLLDNVLGGNHSESDVADGIYTIALLDVTAEIVQEAIIGLSCGEPKVDVSHYCEGDMGTLDVVAVAGSASGQLDLYLDGQIFESGLSDSPWGSSFDAIPEGTYVVGVKSAAQPNEYAFEETVTIDCVEGDGAKPAVAEVEGWCDDTTIGIEIFSFTYGERFDILVDGLEEFSDVFADYYEVGTTSGAHQVVVVNNDGDTIYADIVLNPCDGPAAAARAACATEGTGELFVKTLGGKGYTYSVSVDGQPVADWQDVSDTGGEWESLGVFPMGEHTVLIEWTDDSEGQGSEEVTVNSDCTNDDAGSGAELPVGGSDTTPMMLIAGGLLLAGVGLLTARRLRTA